ncbi:HAMP domain-containing sensor histidine kinase [Paenibacillus gansuensis]|uniref:Sensor histidine kinase n=1 Tax=Paenibacillus gansuensis TaxID=306542 RepID=A0ABW5PK01_9BACL
MENKRLTNMVWRGMSESIMLSLLLCGVFLYFVNYYVSPLSKLTWQGGLHLGLTLGAAVIMIGGAYGFWQFQKMKRRLEVLHESMLYLEKGNLARPVPKLGEDEIGRLGEQLGRISRKWEEQVNSLQRLSTNNAQLAEKARFSAVVEERQRLARELHDAVSQQLFAISMTATAVGRTLGTDFEKAQRQIGLIEEMASVAQSEMRALLLHLRPVHLEGKKLSQGLQELIQELSDRVPIDISFDMDEHIRLVKGVEDHLFRIVQEALSNTLRHSRATTMDIKVQQREDTVKLLIIDNGVGFDLEAQKHAAYGIVSMKERVTEIGGSISIVSAPGKGTRIDIRIPVIVEGGEDVGRNYPH